ncbi:hypothetical protein HRbin15_02593 [bacterium HR15]|nr:hypothetical protein HRbin15_02593 [bacterium HR15]
MIARWLRACALGIGFYVLLVGIHYGTLWGLDQLRQRWEARMETRYGVEAIDREPPYKPGERMVMALDIQLSPYWQEAVGISALLCMPIAILAGISARFIRRARRTALMILTIVSNILLLWLMTQLGGLAFAGYLVGNPTATVAGGTVVGLLQGLLAILVLVRD